MSRERERERESVCACMRERERERERERRLPVITPHAKKTGARLLYSPTSQRR